jgi:hypothetical protein
MSAIPERIASSDWRAAFEYAGPPEPPDYWEADDGVYHGDGEPNVSAVVGSDVPVTGFTRSDVAEVIATDDGENDGPEWLGVFLLRDGRYAVLRAGCDYTGWD